MFVLHMRWRASSMRKEGCDMAGTVVKRRHERKAERKKARNEENMLVLLTFHSHRVFQALCHRSKGNCHTICTP